MIRLQAAGWSHTYAWMADKNGEAVPIENHVQKGEEIEHQLDEYGIACALKYADQINSQEYWDAASTLAFDLVMHGMNFEGIDDIMDMEEELEIQLDPANIQIFKKALQLPSFRMKMSDLLKLYKERGIKSKVGSASREIHTLFERLMMRVRVGGVINTHDSTTTDIYFRIPDTQANGWYTAIGNFLFDHPQYVGFRLHIYQEANHAGERKELESYTDGKEFIDLHASRNVDSYKQKRLNAAYRHRKFNAARFLESVKSSV